MPGRKSDGVRRGLILRLLLLNGEILVTQFGGLRAMAWGLSGASVAGGIHALGTHGLPLFGQTPRVWSYAAMMALGSTIIPVLLMGWHVERLGASRAAILGLAGPALTALLAWTLLSEHLGLSGWLGLTITTVGAAAVGGKPRQIQGGISSNGISALPPADACNLVSTPHTDSAPAIRP